MDSGGRCNAVCLGEGIDSFCGALPAEDFAGSVVEFVLHGSPRLAMAIQHCALAIPGSRFDCGPIFGSFVLANSPAVWGKVFFGEGERTLF